MKPLADTMTARSTIGGETRAMSIDADATAHLMGLLTNIYSDPIMAVIREYSTNALDATIEAGSAEPIRVTLPTHADPNFRVQDFGVGMTVDTILDHYSLYGRSDKRDSNDVVGMLGIGCKSALTYSNSFSVESVRNGTRVVALIAKNADGVGEIEIVDTVSTTERNGTTVVIPARAGDIYSFVNRADTLFQYWEKGTVLVNGEAPEHVFDELSQIPGMDVFYSKHSGYDHIVLMGNVPYVCKSDLLNDFRGRSLIIKAEIGDVSFAPSREELFYNVRTNDYLRRTVQKIKDAVRAEVEAVSKTATTKPEAFALRGRNGEFSFLSDVKWEFNGENIPAWIDSQGQLIWSATDYPQGRAKAQTRWRVLGNDTRTVFIHNYPLTSVTARVKESLVAWSQDDKHDFAGMERFVLASGRVSDWVESYDWNDYKKDLVKAPKTAGTRYVNPRSGRIIDKHGNVSHNSEPASDYPDDEFYVVSPESLRENGTGWTSRAIAVGVKPVLVYKRDDKAFRDEYACVDLSEINKRFADIDKKRTDDDYLGRAVRHDGILSKFDPKKILDPDIVAMLELAKHGEDVDFTYNMNTDRWHKAVRKAAGCYNGYPMITRAWHVTNEEITEYVNALYTYRNGN